MAMNLRRIANVLAVVAIVAIAGQTGAQSPPVNDKSATGEKAVAGAAAKANVMVVELKLRAPDGDARRYRKPYVAVWIKDREGYPVRTLSVWVQKTQPGPRWYPDLRSWYRDEKILEMFENKSRIDAISGPTRAAGTYKVGWDGLDDQGQPVKPGKYTLLIESAREHGPYSLVKEALELGDQPLSKKVDGNGDIESLEYKFTGKLVAP